VADLVAIEPLSEPLEANPWAWGPYCWRFANARAFKTPIAAKGKLNLYSLVPALTPQVDAAIAAAQKVPADSQFAEWMKAIFADEAKDRAVGLCDSYVALGDGRNLLRLAERSVINSGDSDAYANRAIAKWFLEDRAGALADVNRSIDLDKQSPRPYSIRSIIYEATGETRLAESDRLTAEKLENRHGTRADSSPNDDD
jgi:Flp pilus assembly protein TadD